MGIRENVWEKEYQLPRDEIENKYLIFIDNVGGTAVEYESACVAERQREAAAIAAVVPPPALGGAEGGGGGTGAAAAVPAGPGWHAERAL